MTTQHLMQCTCGCSVRLHRQWPDLIYTWVAVTSLSCTLWRLAQ